jgi:hypothetical protein
MLGTAQFELSRGPHAPDDQDKEVCLVEAAIIAAGFERRKVNLLNDCPPCFSRVLARYAILLNDGMPDNLRTELLLPFVTRLAGTAAAPDIEAAREQFIEEQSQSLAQANQSNPRTLWTMAALILDGAITLANSRPAETMSALTSSASATSMNPTALVAGVPGEGVFQPRRELEFA